MAWWKFAAGAPEEGNAADESPTSLDHLMERDRLTDPVMALLASLTRTEASANMISLSNPGSVLVDFVRTQGNRLTLRVRDPEPATMQIFGPLSCVLLVHVTGKHADIVVGSVIREPTLVNGRWLVLLEAGQKLLRADARRTYRVPVVPEADLQAVVRGPDGVRYHVTAHDISQGGIGGELRDAPETVLPLGSPAQVALKCGEHVVWLDAEVRFRRGKGIGLFFPGSWHRDDVEAPPELRAIVRRVEMAWIRDQRGEEAC
jgi:hypothetical protein